MDNELKLTPVVLGRMHNGNLVGFIAECSLPLAWTEAGRNIGGYHSGYDLSFEELKTAEHAFRTADSTVSGRIVKEKWDRDLRIIGETVVGSIEKLDRGDWYAYGCMSDWQDTDLGSHKSERAAKRAVERWVAENRTPDSAVPEHREIRSEA